MMQQPPPAANGAAAGSGQIPSDQQAYHHHQSWMMQQQQGQPPAAWNPQSAPSPVQQYGGGSQTPGSAGEIKSLWIGDLQPWMDEGYLMSIFSITGEVIRNVNFTPFEEIKLNPL